MKKRMTSPESEDPAVLDQPIDEEVGEIEHDVQTSHKAGSKSRAQKEAGSRYPERSTPASHRPAGAFGREPEAESRSPRKKR